MSPDDRNRVDRGMDRGADDRGFSDRNKFAEDLGLDGELDRGADDRGFSDRNLAAGAAGAAGLDRGAEGLDRGFSDRNLSSVDRGMDESNLTSIDRGFEDRGFEDRGLEDRGFEDRGLEDRGVDYSELEEQLTQSGRQARLQSAGGMPSVIYAAELRERLVAKLENQRPPLLPFGLGQRLARVVPVSVVALLFAVAMVGAAQLNLGVPSPSESPVAVTDEPTPTEVPGTFQPEATDNPQPNVPVAPPPTNAPAATPKPSTAPPPTPAPTPPPPPPPPPGPVPMTLSLKSCDGGVVLSWSKYKSGGFNHYTTLRNTANNVPLAYPPQGGAVDFGGTYTTDPHVLSAVDATGSPFTTYYYRTMAFNGSNGVIGASAVVSAQMLPTASLGSVGVSPDAGGTLVTWNPYGGHGACFTWYKVVASTTNPNPSYLTGDPYVYAGSSQGESSTVVTDFVSGETYYVRVQAIKSTALGLFVAAQTDVATYTVP